MTTREDVRIKLTERIEALKLTWTDYPLVVEYDNAEAVNEAEQSTPYLSVRQVYMDGNQTSLSLNPTHRALGTIILEARAKQGEGTARLNKLLEHFYPSVHMTDSMSPLRTFAARFGSSPAKLGWVGQAALIPFWFDSAP